MPADASFTELSFPQAVAVNVASVDHDLKTDFKSQPYARSLYIGGPTVNTLSTIAVDLAGGSTNVSFSVIPGTKLYGAFTKVYHSGTTATLIVAQG